MALTKKEKEILWIAGAIVLLVLLIVIFSGGSSSDEPGSSELTDLTQPAEEERVVEQTFAEILETFPEGFPVESGASESVGYMYIPANSLEEQSTLSYASQDTVSENGIIFASFLEEKGFEIVNQTEEEGSQFFYATKDGNDLSITVEELDGEVQVSVSYLKR